MPRRRRPLPALLPASHAALMAAAGTHWRHNPLIAKFAKSTAPTYVWRIQRFDGLTPDYDEQVPGNDFTENRMRELLRALACTVLTSREIVEAIAKRKRGDPSLKSAEASNRIYGPLLHVRREVSQGKLILSCGENPHFVASLSQAPSES